MIILGPVAVAENGVIGKGNSLPWHLPEDLKHFKQITLNKTVLMGRKTYESIVARLGKPLPDRRNVVITRQPDYKVPDGVLVFSTLEQAFKELLEEDIYVIGGAEIYKQALPYASKMYLTKVLGEYEGDAFFPEIDFSHWKTVQEENHEKFIYYTYVKL